MAKKKLEDLSEAQQDVLVTNAFPPGQSGNKKGRKPNPPEVKTFMKERSLEAAQNLWAIGTDPNVAPQHRVKALTPFIDPFVAKAAQQIDVKHEVADIEELMQLAAQNRQQRQRMIIDARPEDVQEVAE